MNLSSGRIGVGGSFYSHYYGEEQLADMFFHFGSCNSMRTDKLAEGIRSREQLGRGLDRIRLLQ